jgi:prolipoprotein diacylglyceryltransferase
MLVVLSLTLIIIGEWIMWEAVVKSLRSCCPDGWSRDFPSPFYIFYAPIWFWHDLSITMVIVSAVILAYLALRGNNICR